MDGTGLVGVGEEGRVVRVWVIGGSRGGAGFCAVGEQGGRWKVGRREEEGLSKFEIRPIS